VVILWLESDAMGNAKEGLGWVLMLKAERGTCLYAARESSWLIELGNATVDERLGALRIGPASKLRKLLSDILSVPSTCPHLSFTHLYLGLWLLLGVCALIVILHCTPVADVVRLITLTPTQSYHQLRAPPRRTLYPQLPTPVCAITGWLQQRVKSHCKRRTGTCMRCTRR
jgi:hypothetical protein